MNNEEVKELKEKIIVLQNFHRVKDKKLKLFEEERERHNKLIAKQKEEINSLKKSFNQCVCQFEDLEFALRTVKKTQETIKVSQVIELLETMKKQRREQLNEHTEGKEVTIVCMEK